MTVCQHRPSRHGVLPGLGGAKVADTASSESDKDRLCFCDGILGQGRRSMRPPLAQDTQQKLIQAVQEFSTGCKTGMDEFYAQAGDADPALSLASFPWIRSPGEYSLCWTFPHLPTSRTVSDSECDRGPLSQRTDAQIKQLCVCACVCVRVCVYTLILS